MKTTLGIAFHGAARTVTGSRHLLTFGSRKLLFDCGLYQGRRDEAERINRTFRFDPAELDTVVISHAHVDHIGNLPTLVARGYAGPIHMTPATAELAAVLLADSAFLMQKDLEHVNKRRGGRPERKPLFTMADVEETLTRIVLPNASSGILTGVILAVSRGAGEVAPIIFTGAANFLPYLPTDLRDMYMHLGYHVFALSTQSPNVDQARPVLFATVAVLLLLTFSLNLGAVVLRSRTRAKYAA